RSRGARDSLARGWLRSRRSKNVDSSGPKTRRHGARAISPSREYGGVARRVRRAGGKETLGSSRNSRGIFHPVSASRGPRRYRLACGREFSSKRGGVAAEFVFRLADQSEIERAGTAAALLVLGYRREGRT